MPISPRGTRGLGGIESAIGANRVRDWRYGLIRDARDAAALSVSPVPVHRSRDSALDDSVKPKLGRAAGMNVCPTFTLSLEVLAVFTAVLIIGCGNCAQYIEYLANTRLNRPVILHSQPGRERLVLTQPCPLHRRPQSGGLPLSE